MMMKVDHDNARRVCDVAGRGEKHRQPSNNGGGGERGETYGEVCRGRGGQGEIEMCVFI